MLNGKKKKQLEIQEITFKNRLLILLPTKKIYKVTLN